MSAEGSRTDRSTTGSQIATALAGGLAGVVAGLAVAQLFGGFGGLWARVRRLAQDELGFDHGFEPGADGLDGIDDDDDDDDEGREWWDDEPLDDNDPDDELGERVLEAFRNDPTLAARPIDIDVHRDATIELSGRVDTDDEIDHATTVASGVLGVQRVLTRLSAKRQD